VLVRRASRVAAWLGPDFTLFFACASALAVVGRLFGAHYVLRLSTMLLPGLVAPGLVAVHLARHGRAGLAATARAAVRDWAPLVLVAIVFDNLAGMSLAVGVCQLAPWLRRRWPR
jgi:hypothetical protein